MRYLALTLLLVGCEDTRYGEGTVVVELSTEDGLGIDGVTELTGSTSEAIAERPPPPIESVHSNNVPYMVTDSTTQLWRIRSDSESDPSFALFVAIPNITPFASELPCWEQAQWINILWMASDLESRTGVYEVAVRDPEGHALFTGYGGATYTTLPLASDTIDVPVSWETDHPDCLGEETWTPGDWVSVGSGRMRVDWTFTSLVEEDTE